ncbi:MAG: carboxypeptidase-like regulatory domain-containing protein [Bacteroidaceae bacterium]|nr:carboxypeptidase-like regulatory domain-containing protein [Bacteroidaceae bacterium]
MVKRLFILSFALILSSVVTAQTTITGRVTDAISGEGIIGATVVPKSSKELGSVTDIDGNFTLVTKEKLPLTISVQYMGYRPQEVDVYDAEESVDVQLTESFSRINEVVVVGYGTQKRTQLTGSVTTLDEEIFSQAIAPTLDAALSGQVAGLNVTPASGQPGAASQIRIRGGNSINASNEPLYVVDGFIYFKDPSLSGTGLGAIESSLNPLSTINPADIERVEV